MGTEATEAHHIEAEHRSAFSQPRFRLYFPSSCLSTLSSWIIRFLFGWAAWELTASAFWVGSIAGLMLVPTFLLTPIFGITADRINPRNGLLVTVSLMGFLAAVAAIIATLGYLELPALAILALAFGVLTSAHAPIRLAFLPRLVERGALPSAIGYSAIIFNTSRIIGPAVGAWLLVVSTVPVAFATAAVICIGAVVMLARVEGTEREVSTEERGSFMAQLRAGFVYLRRDSMLRQVFLLTLASGVLGRTVIELLPAVSGKLLGGDSATLATLTAAAGAGSIAGGLLVSRQSGRLRRLYHLVLLGLFISAMTILTAAFWHEVWVVALAIALIAGCTTTIGTGCQALTQLTVQESYRGRVMSLWAVVAMGTPAIGAVLVGTVADAAGFPVAFAGTAVFALVVVLLLRSRAPDQSVVS
ncbi:MFS transporter [Congregibacter variabilis]|uniref:MFS transporter n=1 Tax=Congregibacter variabilis TaxID=3081200 RepID=A0ABZ0I893_9GAMM|nr:MFS transporter [Congregibacter sp. IMCC43200]